jgi:hypothetical protein
VPKYEEHDDAAAMNETLSEKSQFPIRLTIGKISRCMM